MAIQNTDAKNAATLYSSANKITIGFKVNPELKLRLSSAAQELHLTLSAYVEMLVSNSAHWKDYEVKNNELQTKVDFYETKILRDLYTKHKGKTIDFLTTDGFPISLKINSVQDVFTVFINSYKPSDND